MSGHSNFYVPFLIAGMIITVRSSPLGRTRALTGSQGFLQLALVQVPGPPVRRGLRHGPPRVLRAARLADPADVRHVPFLSISSPHSPL